MESKTWCSRCGGDNFVGTGGPVEWLECLVVLGNVALMEPGGSYGRNWVTGPIRRRDDRVSRLWRLRR